MQLDWITLSFVNLPEFPGFAGNSNKTDEKKNGGAPQFLLHSW
jgi:hypothetical protein